MVEEVVVVGTREIVCDVCLRESAVVVGLVI